MMKQLANNTLYVLMVLCMLSAHLPAQDVGKQIKYLSGTDNEHTVAWDFFCTSGRKSGCWTTINVPSHWEQQGFGEYDYGRDYRTYGKLFRFADETGKYKHTFGVPTNWDGKRVFIVFEGSMTDTQVQVNGQLAGPVHQGAFYRFGYDITELIHPGADNELFVTVNKVSANKSVNRAERYADYWIFGGIYRPVYLEAVPQDHIQRVAIRAEANGLFSVDVFPSLQTKKLSLRCEVINAQGQVVSVSQTKASPGDSLLTLSAQVADPLLWTAETPNRYTAKISLLKNGHAVYRMEQKFGFRTVEIRQGDGVYINGTQVKFKGINRHAFWPETGRCLNAQIDLADVELMKAMNMNAVRCSHYPPDQSFLDYCDSLGLYVLDELAGWQNAYDTEVGQKLVREMVVRDVNHPSIVFWSNGNEGGTNKELDVDFAKYDPQKRPVIHAHHKPGNAYNGIDCNHYENYYSSQKILDEGLIYMPTEFLHGQDDGGMAAGLSDFWELFWRSDRSAGGFLWVLADEGLVRTDLGGVIDANRVNAPDGIVGPHREKEASVYAIREIYSPIIIDANKLPEPFHGKLPVENRYHFINLKDCRFAWELVNFNAPTLRAAGHKVMQSGAIAGPDVAPTSKGELLLGLPADYQQYDALYLKAYDVHGKEVYCWSWKINGNTNSVLQLIDKELSEKEQDHLKKLKAAGIEADNILPIDAQMGDDKVSFKVEAQETDSTLKLKASGIAVTFSKQDGTIVKLTNDFSLPLPFGKGPVLVSGTAKLSTLTHRAAGNTHVAVATYTGDLKTVTWTMHPSGWLQMDYEYLVPDKQHFTGLSFSFPESDIIGAKWLGNGPAHVWKNRLQGGKLDVYQRMYNNVLPGDNNWQYPQFKGYYADVSWMELNTDYGKFTVVAQEEDLFVRLFDFYGLSGPTNYPVLPVGNISFLDAIPAIGTKLAMGISNDTWNLGPAGELAQMDKPVKRTLYFYFGLLN